MPSPRRVWLAVAAMFFLNGGLFGTWASRIPTVAEHHNLDGGWLGLLLLVLASGALISFPLAGRASDTFGAARATLAIAVAYTLALVMIACAFNLWLTAAALFLFGAGHGAMDVTMNSWAGEAERFIAKPVMSSFHAMWSLGAGVGAAAGYMAVSLDLSLLTHFSLIGITMYVSTILLGSIGWQSETRPRAAGAKRFPLPHGVLLWVGIIALCASLGEGAIADWSALFLVTVTSATTAQGAIGYAVFSLAMVIMRLIGGGVISRLGPATAARFAGCSAALGVLLAVLPANFMAALLGFFFLGIGYALIMPLAFSRAANDPDTPPGVAIASVATLGYGGMLLGPPLIGFTAHFVTLHYAFGILGLLALFIVFIAPSLERF
ncbi:MFS transporter [Vreelandella neptunia]|uniref:MFS transporter n=1 Tax=Vreelandella neptunia TaxID=115551 RepID=A0ABZ0YNT8_9GAMM|nr:MFS transporter [Halomonas neptunia]MDN3558672.1 MFS transporter [Halomonas neptunia]TDV92139.1 fucose permease [Halomonas alkaliantarctica]WQH13641.1 MFS transporter [Halomonas neptunia]